MSMAMLPHVEGADGSCPCQSRRARGRPRTDATILARQLHCSVAIARLIERKTYRQICKQYDCSRRAASQWVKDAPHYPDAPAFLRRHAR
jgi:hypothetical protein